MLSTICAIRRSKMKEQQSRYRTLIDPGHAPQAWQDFGSAWLAQPVGSSRAGAPRAWPRRRQALEAAAQLGCVDRARLPGKQEGVAWRLAFSASSARPRPAHLAASPLGIWSLAQRSPSGIHSCPLYLLFRIQGAKCVTLAGWGHPFEGYREGRVLGSSVGWVLMSQSGHIAVRYQVLQEAG